MLASGRSHLWVIRFRFLLCVVLFFGTASKIDSQIPRKLSNGRTPGTSMEAGPPVGAVRAMFGRKRPESRDKNLCAASEVDILQTVLGKI